MIEKIEIQTLFGKQLTLQLRDSSNGLYIKELDGLDPTKSNIVTTSFAGRDGVVKQASRREARYPKIKLGFDMDTGSSVEELRKELYKFFMPKMEVRLRYFSTDGLIVDVDGEIEEFVSPRMVQEPEATISIFCFESDFRGTTLKIVQDMTTVPDTGVPGILDYAGSVETGFRLYFTVNAATSGFVLSNTPGDGLPRVLDFEYPLLVGDFIEISTVTGDKGAWITRGGTRRSALSGITRTSDWVQLYPDENRISVLMEGVPVQYTIEYTDKYGGI